MAAENVRLWQAKEDAAAPTGVFREGLQGRGCTVSAGRFSVTRALLESYL